MATQAMTVANDQTLTQMIDGAQRRLVFLAPGVSRPVALTIANCFKRLPHERITVILDVDPEVCRLGYGKIDAMEMLEKAISEQGGMLLRQPGVRIGLVIADGQTMVFAPTPELIEAAPKSAQFKPNAIRIGNVPPADIERDLGLGPEGELEQRIGLDPATRATIKQAKDDLKANPPQQFNIARKVRVFNAQFEFVELSLRGAAIDRKSVQLPAALLGLSELKSSLHTRLNLVDEENTRTGERLQKMKAWIVKTFLTHIPGYGFVVLRKDKDRLIMAVQKLERCARKGQKRIWREVQQQLDRKRKALTVALLPLVERNASTWQNLLVPPGPRKFLEQELERVIGRSAELVKDIEVRLIFKAVTYESLIDPKFIDLIRANLPGLQQLHEEFDAAAGQRPIDNPKPPEMTPR